MSNDNIIRFILNLKDKKITIGDEFYSKTENHITYKYICATVDKHFSNCTHCGSKLIKYGTKLSYITMPDLSNCPARLRLKKQRYRCPHCGKIYTSQSRELVAQNCYISEKTKQAISTALINDSTRNITSLSKQFRVSPHNIWRVLENSNIEKEVKPFYLPEKLCFDEFKSTKSCVSSMSFVYCDGVEHKLLGVLHSRKKEDIINYFLGFTYDARKMVKSVCMDLYSPYIEVVKAVFPNANIVFDRFHMAQLISRSLN